MPQLLSRGSLTSPSSNDLLRWRHPVVPFPKPNNPRLRLPKTPGNSPFWEGEYKFNDKGEMININQKKIDAQKGVLTQLIKSFGRSLFSGKSILSISLPVTVFSRDSNLSLLCKSFCFAPLLLEKAVKQSNPVDRFKYCVAFALSITNAYI